MDFLDKALTRTVLCGTKCVVKQGWDNKTIHKGDTLPLLEENEYDEALSNSAITSAVTHQTILFGGGAAPIFKIRVVGSENKLTEQDFEKE